MNDRHRARVAAIQFLFQREFQRGDLREALDLFWGSDRLEDSELPRRMRVFAERLVQGVEDQRRELDERLQSYAEHWSLQRMARVDLNVMRVALYEIFHCPETPPVVAVNEALNAARELSGREAARFVNGILDRALRDAGRPLRERSAVPGSSAGEEN